jgi:hypothetical protein
MAGEPSPCRPAVNLTSATLAFSPGGGRAARRIWCRAAGWRVAGVAAARWPGQAVWDDLAVAGGQGWEHGRRAACDAERTWDESPEV